MGGATAGPGYDAFISYSHALDGELAPAVQHGLHRLARRWYRIRALRVFRDESSLSVTPNLRSAIETALADSRFFVLLASPEAAASPWVRKEITFWQRKRERDKFLIAVTSGRVAWDADAGDFDWSVTTALPDVLRDYFDTEPLWVDLGWARGVNDLSLRHSGFRDAVGMLAAPMHGRPKDELDGEDVHQHRVFTRVRRAAVAAITLLLVISTTAGFVAVRQRDAAQAQARIATSQALAARSVALAATDPRLAVQLALYAHKLSPTVEARSAMATLVETNSHVRAHVRAGGDEVAGYRGSAGLSISRVALSGDGQILAYHSGVTESNQVHLYDTRTNREITTLPVEGNGDPIELSGDGRRLALLGPESVDVWDVPSRSRVRVVDVVDGGQEFTGMALSPDGRWLATSQDQINGARDPVRVWDLESGSRATSLDAVGPAPTTMRFTGDSRLLLINTTSGNQRTFELAGATWTEPEPFPTIDKATVIPDASGKRAVALVDGELQLWDLLGQSRLTSRPLSVDYGAAEVSDDGRLVIVGTSTGEVIVYEDDLRQETRVTGHQHTVTDVAVAADGSTYASTGEDGSVTWGRSREHNHRSALPGTGEATVSLDGRVALRATETGTEVWDVTMGERRGTLPFIAANLPHRIYSLSSSIEATSGLERLATLENVNGYLSMWDVQTGELIYRRVAGIKSNVRFLPDDRHLIAVTDLGLTVIDTNDYTVSQVLDEDPENFVTSADGRFVAVVTNSGRDKSTGKYPPNVVDVWRWRDSGRLDHEHSGLLDMPETLYPDGVVALDSDGSSIALQDPDGRVHVFDVDTGVRSSVLNARLGGSSNGIAFNADGSILVQKGTWAGRSTLLLWDVATGGLLAPWSLPDKLETWRHRRTYSTTINAGKTVVSVGDYSNIDRWTIDVDSWRNMLCAIAGDDLTERDRERYLSNVAVEAPCRQR